MVILVSLFPGAAVNACMDAHMKWLQQKMWMLMSAADALDYFRGHSSCDPRCRQMLFFNLSIYGVKGKLAEAELNPNPLKHARTWTVHPDGLWFSSATGGLHYTPEYHVHLREPRTILQWPFMLSVWSDRLWLRASVRDTRQKYWRHSTLGLPFSFNSFDPSKDLQSLLFKCYFLPKR